MLIHTSIALHRRPVVEREPFTPIETFLMSVGIVAALVAIGLPWAAYVRRLTTRRPVPIPEWISDPAVRQRLLSGRRA